MKLINTTRRLPNYVREQLLQTAALLAKRGWIEASVQERDDIIKDAFDLLQGSAFEVGCRVTAIHVC